ncbi:GTP-binding protein EngB [Methylophaga frappieri]|uniref:Probable GTP-binding protein EngB n=1 Tax=Methylophaga frappieri (strain ATCC BAA-2434 / DSM 25690 / JAM7) TaxID=754477 RepID=I1YIM4_METFJ|nr:ribosome biogenesis GTP-binding protein YihA/YsxC [Methylophaga frappieri]AFJ02767.1 GTP-binding protein EngB [Methylophaga frappieri]
MSEVYRRAQYTGSAAQLDQLPADTGIEVAFAGRSNAGKSSAINTITQINGLARISKTPGRTQMINFFTLDETRALVDLPGYGFAKVPEKMKLQWQATLGKYLESRQSLKGLVLMMDCRHPMKEFDLQILLWAKAAALPLHILLTKSDKLSRGAGNGVLQKVRQQLQRTDIPATVQLFSSLNKSGRDQAISQLDEWFNLPEQPASAS